jgi:hypothetical protein
MTEQSPKPEAQELRTSNRTLDISRRKKEEGRRKKIDVKNAYIASRRAI